MKLVVDSNILFASIIGRGKTMEVIKSDKLELISPTFSLGEIREHQSEILEKTGFTEDELTMFIESLKTEIKFAPLREYLKFFEQAIPLSVDPDDIDFFALSLSKDKLPIWSNDSHFKLQAEIKVFTTSELLDALGLK